jgi:hypothetical protein
MAVGLYLVDGLILVIRPSEVTVREVFEESVI